MNVTNAVPPICTKHHETMVLSFYDRPGSPPGNGYSCRSCTQERLASPPEPKMQRALAEGEFNVVGDELRKLEKKGDSMFRALSEYVSDRTTVICDGITRIESQLMALRAEADKVREPMLQKMDNLHEVTTHELIAIRNWIGKVADVRALIPNGLKALAVDIDQQSAIKFEGLEERIGYMFGALAKEMHRCARKKKQERKRPARKSR